MPSQITAAEATFVLLRTPLLPFETLTTWARDVEAAPAAAHADGAEIAARDRERLITRLKALVASPEIREAIFIASRSTHDQIDRWLSGSTPNERLEQTLARYVQRMASRATPFGMFAGCSLSNIGERRLAIGPRTEYRRYARVDNGHVAQITSRLSRRPEVRAQLRYWPNSSLYLLARRWRYVRTSLPEGDRHHALMALTPDPFLDAAIGCARAGATLNEITNAVMAADADDDLRREEVIAYVEELIDEQVLESTLQPVVTGAEALDDLLGQLAGLTACATDRQTLVEVRDELRHFAAAEPGHAPDVYARIAAHLETLAPVGDTSRLLQVDLVKPSGYASLDREVLETIASGVDLLFRLVAKPRDPLRAFKNAFLARYDRRWVRLVDVLDEDAGIGFNRVDSPTANTAPLLRGLPVGGGYGDDGRTFGSRDSFVLTRLDQLTREGKRVWELSDEDIAQLSQGPQRTAPASLGATVVLSGPDADWQVWVAGASGPSSGRLLGRFCHGMPDLAARLRQELAMEEREQPDALFAEIAHLPEGRLANVLSRPLLREYEIPYLGRSGAPGDRQIAVDSLLVTVVNDRVVLWSEQQGAEIVPRMSTAHSFWRGHAIYRFLCALQAQDVVEGAAWNWGALEAASALPRVTHGRLVLSRARWTMPEAMMKRVTAGSTTEGFSALQQWRSDFAVPRFLTLLDGDNELLVDLDNVLSVEAWLAQHRTGQIARLAELWPSPDALACAGPDGRFVHQMLVPLRAAPGASRAVTTPAPAADVRARRKGPSSEWLYAKFYCGPSDVDVLVGRDLPPFLVSQTSAGAITQWFFVRYRDDESHLRLRMKGDPARLGAEVLPALGQLQERLSEDDLVWKFQLDTYEREIERYGGDAALALCEEIFWHDSQAVAQILAMAEGDAGMDVRWQLCLKGWELLLQDFGLDLSAQHGFSVASRDRIRAGNPGLEAMRHPLGRRFREERQVIDQLMLETTDDALLRAGLDALRTRGDAVRPLVSALDRTRRWEPTDAGRSALLGDLLHMHANRILRTAHATQEYVIYEFLVRFCESALARQRRG